MGMGSRTDSELLKFNRHKNVLENLLQYRLLGPIPEIPFLKVLERGQRIYISNKLPGEAAASA